MADTRSEVGNEQAKHGPENKEGEQGLLLWLYQKDSKINLNKLQTGKDWTI